MKYSLLIATIILVFITNKFFAQDIYSNLSQYTVSIGYVDSVVIQQVPLKKEKRFILIGSGLLTYTKKDTAIMGSVVTAKHILKFFEDSKRDSIFIRFSWADTITISKYFGMAIPMHLSNKIPTFFYHKDKDIDLGCILLPSLISDKIVEEYYSKRNAKVSIFPYNRIVNPDLGDNVFVYGYPGHIENYFETASFLVCTFKPGVVTWKSNQTKTFLDNILLVESNASYGNSGGPVFSLNNGFRNGRFIAASEPSLVGILIGGTEEINELKSNGRQILDSAGKTYYITNRSGVSIVLKAELIKELLAQVNQVLTKK